MNEYVMFADYHTRKMSITNVSFSLLVILTFVCTVYLCLHVYIYVFVCVCMCVYIC